MHYYIRQRDGRVSGPYPISTTKQLIKEGKVRADMEFSEDREEWIWGIELADLFPDAFRAPRGGPGRGRRPGGRNRKA